MLKATKGATKGWLFFSLAGGAFFFWTTLQSIFTLTDIYVGRVITSILFMSGTILLVMGTARLAEDFGINKPKWISAKNFLIINLVIIVVLAVGLFMFNNDVLQVLLTTVIVNSMLANLMGAIAAIYLLRATGKGIWVAMLIFMITFGLGQGFCVYAGNCCTGEFADSPVCQDYDLDYTNVFNLPCSVMLTNISVVGYNLMTVGGLILLGNFFYLWRKLA
ncbi:MAG: hypothetical protein ACOCQX_02130 [Candidatus Nanoarchaeia archaeon]